MPIRSNVLAAILATGAITHAQPPGGYPSIILHRPATTQPPTRPARRRLALRQLTRAEWLTLRRLKKVARRERADYLKTVREYSANHTTTIIDVARSTITKSKTAADRREDKDVLRHQWRIVFEKSGAGELLEAVPLHFRRGRYTYRIRTYRADGKVVAELRDAQGRLVEDLDADRIGTARVEDRAVRNLGEIDGPHALTVRMVKTEPGADRPVWYIVLERKLLARRRPVPHGSPATRR